MRGSTGKWSWSRVSASVAPAVLVVLASCGAIGPAIAAPAAGLAEEIAQPDGDSFEAETKGDEWHNWVQTVEGYTVALEADGFWHYVRGYQANGVPIIDPAFAHQGPPAGIPKSLVPPVIGPARAPLQDDESAPSPAPYGELSSSVLFILAQFDDRAGQTSEASWAGFVTNNIAKFYAVASHGEVSLSPATDSWGTVGNGVVGWLDMGYDHPDTGGNTGQANRQLARDAIVAADPYVDFSAYDTDSDGYVDSDELAVVIIAAGYERSFSSNYSPTVWGHKWSIFSPSAPVVDGVIVGSFHSGQGGYAQFGELHRSSASDQHQATMGIMVHELGHLIFGLPDLYDTDGSSSGIGTFGVMGAGSWGRSSTDTHSGETPVLPSAWVRYIRGWADCQTGIGTESIAAAGSDTATGSNACYRATTSAGGEYFLVENRQAVGYDAGLWRYLGNSFGGLAIWHIDDNEFNNTDDNHRWVDLEEADGTVMGTSKGQATDLWFLGNATEFNGTSNPASTLYSNAASGVDINSISTTGEVMTARFGGTSAPSATTNAATGVGQSGATLNGSVNPNGASTTVYYDYGLTTGYGSTVTYGNVGSGTNEVSAPRPMIGLQCGTTYHFRIRATNSGGAANGADRTFATSACPQAAPNATTNAATGVTQSSATLNGSINPNGASTTAYYDYGLTTGYGNTVTYGSVGSGISNVSVPHPVSGLQCGSTYHFRARAINSGGTTSGADRTFATSACPQAAPGVTTNAAGGIGQVSATLNGNFNPFGANTTAYYDYGLTAGYGHTVSYGSVGSGTSSVSAPRAVIGLQCGTAYHFRARASNIAGTSNGADQTFDTAGCGGTSVHLGNISTRAQVLSGHGVLIGGFIIEGSAPKTVLVRARGPSVNVPDGETRLGDPNLRLFAGANVIAASDNWESSADAEAIQATGLAPSNSLESAIMIILDPGAYTGVVNGVGGLTGVGIVEVFDVDGIGSGSRLVNISTRSRVLKGNGVTIAGFIVEGDQPQTVLIRGRGPSVNVPDGETRLGNPNLRLFEGASVVAANDDWQASPDAAAIHASGLGPANDLESAILVTLDPGVYTAIVNGVNGATGIGMVEVLAAD